MSQHYARDPVTAGVLKPATLESILPLPPQRLNVREVSRCCTCWVVPYCSITCSLHASADPIGALPPARGKRHLETFRELGRAAAAQMKYVAIADEDPAPKRGKGEATATEQGQGRAFAVFPRGDKASRRSRTRPESFDLCTRSFSPAFFWGKQS